MGEFAFQHPWLLLAIFLPILIRLLAPPREVTDAYLHAPFTRELSALTGGNQSFAMVNGGNLIQRVLLVLVWILLTIALARPQWIDEPIIRELPGRDLLIAIDLSGSMAARDFRDAAGEPIDRLSAVKEIMDEFLTRRDGDRVGLLFFGTSPFIQVPFTDDLEVCRKLLKEAQVRMAGPQTMLGDAVGKAITVFKSSNVAEKVLIVLADGNDSGSLVPPLKAAGLARDEGIKIHTIGMGDPTTVGEEKLDTLTLESMATTTGGQFFLAIDRSELERVYENIDQIMTKDVETVSYRPVNDLYFWPLLFAVITTLAYHGVRLAATWVNGKTTEVTPESDLS
jgi:Ca-activated chloride channel family protein